MTTLSVDTYRKIVVGDINEFDVIAADIIFEGAAVGLVGASGHARPLSAAANEKFVGFAEQKADNSAGAASAIRVRVIKKGAVVLAVSGAVITDIDQPIYATDDNTFVFSPVSALFIGRVRRFVASGIVEVEFDVDKFVDPWEGYVREVGSIDLLLDIQDSGKVIFIDTDAKTFTLPATVVGYRYILANIGAYGTVICKVSPNSSDLIAGMNTAGANNKAQINTKATAQRGDFIELIGDGGDGWYIIKRKGVWAQEG